MSLVRTAFGPEIQSAAEKHGLDPKLLESIVIVESGGKASAYRFEPNYHRLYLSKDPFWSKQNPLRVSASYGLCQLMCPTAVQVGFPKSDPPELLFVPETNLEYAGRYLALLKKKFGDDVEALLSAYNAGPGNAKRPFPNQPYISKVLRHYAV